MASSDEPKPAPPAEVGIRRWLRETEAEEPVAGEAEDNAYSSEGLAEMVAILERAIDRVAGEPDAKVTQPCEEVLCERLMDCLAPVFEVPWKQRASRKPDAWDEYSRDPSPSELAKNASAVAEAAQRLQQLLKTTWGQTSIPGRARQNARTLRDFHKRLAALIELVDDTRSHHKAQTRRGAKRKAQCDAALLPLADLYAELTGTLVDLRKLSHHKNSIFVRFAALALTPWLPDTERTLAAIGNRWQRLKQDMGRLQPDEPEPEPDQN